MCARADFLAASRRSRLLGGATTLIIANEEGHPVRQPSSVAPTIQFFCCLLLLLAYNTCLTGRARVAGERALADVRLRVGLAVL